MDTMEHRIHIEKNLVQKIVNGDKLAFRKLVDQLMKPAYFHALAILHNHDDAVELSQQAFIRTWDSRNQIDPDRPFYNWFYTVLKNLCLNYSRDQYRRKETPLKNVESWIEPEMTSDPSYEILKLEDQKMIQQALEKLNVSDRELIVMKDIENYSYKDIAEVLDVPPGTVMSRLYHARKRFKHLMEEAGYEYY